MNQVGTSKLWENYRERELYVSRSIWNGRVSDPKTRKGRAPVPVIRQLAERLEMHRLRSSNPTVGPIFANSGGMRATHSSVYWIRQLHESAYASLARASTETSSRRNSIL